MATCCDCAYQWLKSFLCGALTRRIRLAGDRRFASGFGEGETVKQVETFKWLPVVVEDLCTGCGLCVEACGPACLETANGVALLERPNDCGSEEHCISACPEDAIHMNWLKVAGDQTIGLWQSPANAESESASSTPDLLSVHNCRC